ncbi:ATP synthase subunit C [Phenylobacterium sp. CCH12-B4]|uniref:ATP synthase subunit C n=1 Tax=Phenylobacterium sp. CCH12-B4 TaxID=1768784 RepID=UPI00083B8835|nr:ATP synthase subunit C [Phenylobacterium sp. CCH12-B4]
MDPAAAKYIGAGLATLGMIGAGIGVGTLFGGAALTEALGILAFVLGLLILFS